MFLNMKPLAVSAFIASVIASPLDARGSSVLVGYRTVRPEQAAEYAKNGGKLVWTRSESSEQTGRGVYISPKIGEWPGADTNWDCAILADSPAWNLVNKAWVPETDGSKSLWWKSGAANRAAYLAALGGKAFTASNAVLLSKIGGYELLQILIPPELLDPKVGLNIITHCAPKKDKLAIAAISEYGSADWICWDNVKGEPPARCNEVRGLQAKI